ncbi:allantoate deiminase [Sporosarcina luteola]|nr:allantoate deiminase [Sporosarcina luteola]
MTIKQVTEKQGVGRKVEWKQKGSILLLALAVLCALTILLNQILSYPILELLLLGIICITGFGLHKWMSSYSAKKLPFETWLQVEFPEKIIRLRTWGFELVFALILLSLGADPIKDLMDLKTPVYQINSLFLELAVLFTILSVLPMLFYYLFDKWRRTYPEKPMMSNKQKSEVRIMNEQLYDCLMADYDEALSHGGINGNRIARRLNELSAIGQTKDGGVDRPGFSKEEKDAKQLVKGWMKEAGLDVREDGIGNVFGRLKGKDDQRVILSGSHVDSVPNGGNFDGPLGVIAALEVVEAWKSSGYQPETSYEVVIFSDEEGSRFGTGLTGSHAMVGKLIAEETARLKDAEGNSFAAVMEQYGTSLNGVWQAKRSMNEIELFVEVHIEQGKRLEQHNLPVGVVKGIAGPVWMNITFNGEAGHAGNTPMDDRKDPVVAAGSFMHQLADLPRRFSETAVATVGKLNVYPNGINVIAQKVELTVDVRDILLDEREHLVEAIIEMAQSAGKQYNVSVSHEEMLAVDPLLIEPLLTAGLKESVARFELEPLELVSGAGHDAMVVGREVPAAMIFVRSQKGISHNPEEWTDLNDCVMAVHVLKDFIENRMVQ